MLIALKFIAAIALLAALHIAVMAVLGRWLGIAVRQVSLGFGPVLFSFGIFQLRALPFGGSVTFKDTRSEDTTDEAPAEHGRVDDAFDHQPRAVQVLLPLAGAASLAVVALLLHPGSALAGIGHGFAQIVAGGVSPLGTAQELIEGARAFATQQGFLPLLGMLAAKLAALNLLPLPAMNGGQALLALMKRDLHEDSSPWLQRLTEWGLWLCVALALSWAVGIGVFAVQVL
ncbi:membrane-associated protease RseP (regulator of RpoE activity) [Variovorax boronicumulans]|uniref:site-2 protease family protein n=1 Tax=Variovorax boronicumulans TaxID=436515 RepID=UPI00278616C8|nr:site-2 protease family protein [Variovorax boronicumulans]MDP9993778.1 membrane-associated protease RseP (regulator of RpoE activity) [Variovorax boronicumulans]MDQ0005079.1 membrane-associated protease RseP (regulator of RpoE activity) [Variovorax boronicumulans]